MSDPLLIQKLQTDMRYLSQRQTVLAQNIANVDTPGYHAQDLKKLNFDDMASAESGKLQMKATSAKHLSGSLSSGSGFSAEKIESAEEIKPGGNNVVLDEQLAKVSDVGAQHQLSTSLLHKYNQLYATALDSHGGS